MAFSCQWKVHHQGIGCSFHHFFWLGVTNNAAKPNCVVPIGDNGSLYEGCSSGKLIVIKNQWNTALVKAAVVSKMQTPAIPLWFSEQCLLGFFILEKQLASQDMFLVRSKFLLLCISFLYCIDLHPYSCYCFSKILRPFCASRSWWIIIVFLQSNSVTITKVSQKYWDLLQPYSHDHFSKISKTFYASRK